MIDSSFSKIYIPNTSGSYDEISSIKNFSFSKNIAYENPYVLGGGISAIQVVFPTPSEISFERTFIQDDSLFKYTGKDPLETLYIYNGSNFNKLTNLYLTSYSAGFSVGELPKINTKFLSFSDLDKSDIYSLNSNIINNNYDTINIPKLSSITIDTLNDDNMKNQLSYNNIYSFDYSLNIKRQPYYSIGEKEPTEICPILPIEISFSLNSKILDRDNPLLNLNTLPDNFNFDIKVSGSNDTFSRFPIRNARLVSKEKQIQSSNTIEVKTKFVGYYGL